MNQQQTKKDSQPHESFLKSANHSFKKYHFRKLIRSRVYAAVTSIFLMILIGTWLFYNLEDWSIAESFYFTVATITTVGYGDLHPTSDLSRVIAALFILAGVGIVATALGSIGTVYAERHDQDLEQIEEEISEQD